MDILSDIRSKPTTTDGFTCYKPRMFSKKREVLITLSLFFYSLQNFERQANHGLRRSSSL